MSQVEPPVMTWKERGSRLVFALCVMGWLWSAQHTSLWGALAMFTFAFFGTVSARAIWRLV